MTKHFVEMPEKFFDDWYPAYEDMENEALGMRPESGVVELIEAVHDALERDMWIKKGRGRVLLVQLSADAIRRLQGEAKYRWEFHLPASRNPYGNEWIDPAARNAAKRLYDRCQTALQDLTN